MTQSPEIGLLTYFKQTLTEYEIPPPIEKQPHFNIILHA